MEYKLPLECCQFLLNAASKFGLPDKLGDVNYTSVDKSLAYDEVRHLYRVLRAASPALQDSSLSSRLPIFGTVDEWEFEYDANKKPVTGRLKDPAKEVVLDLDSTSVSGAMWCLLLALHPEGREHRVNVTLAETVVWLIAERLRKRQTLKEALGLTKVEKRRRWDDDPVEVAK
jgi:hypothetical protein